MRHPNLKRAILPRHQQLLSPEKVVFIRLHCYPKQRSILSLGYGGSRSYFHVYFDVCDTTTFLTLLKMVEYNEASKTTLSRKENSLYFRCINAILIVVWWIDTCPITKKHAFILGSYVEWTTYQMRKIAGCTCTGNTGNVFAATDFKVTRQLAITACVTARACRTCRDACRDR